jgi:drug/metabolite transporter (DMT)-like permease
MTRVLSRTETNMALLFHVTLTGAVILGALSLPQLPALELEAGDVWAVIGLGLASTLGHFLFTAAYREAPPSLLGPITYMHLVWAAGLGWVVFAHVPDAVTVCGIVLVAAAGAGTAWHAHRSRMRQFRPMPPE